MEGDLQVETRGVKRETRLYRAYSSGYKFYSASSGNGKPLKGFKKRDMIKATFCRHRSTLFCGEWTDWEQEGM